MSATETRQNGGRGSATLGRQATRKRRSSQGDLQQSSVSCKTDAVRMVGYVRVSTGEQAENGVGLDAQRHAITVAMAGRGFELVDVIEDAGVSGKSLARPGLERALALLESGSADGLVVAKLDRLSRSLLDFAALTERSRRKGWALIALDLGVDTSTPQGEMLANVLATFAQFERRLIGQRTKDALAVKRAQGVRLGRPPTVPAKIRTRIKGMRTRGWTLQRIADTLSAENIPTAQGGKRWYPSTVAALLNGGRK